MSDQLVEIFESFDDSLAVEMTGDGVSGLVPLRPELVAEITQGDDNPKFGTYVIESGWSKSKRFWGPELFHDVVAEINNSVEGGEAVVGYMGHIPKELDAFSFPPIQLQWVGAKIVHNSGDKARLAVKGYFLPGTQARQYADRKNPLVKSVSWRGKVQQEVFGHGVKIKKFLLESIDLARPRTAGMNARLVALTSEMEDERSDTVKPEEISALQENELRAHNPGLVSQIEAAARQPLETKVGEMTEAAAGVKKTLDLIPEFRKMLNLSDDTDELNTLQAVVQHLRTHGKAIRDAVLDKVLAKKLAGGEEKDRLLVRSLIAAEMRDKEFQVTGDEEKDERAVSEMVDSIIDSSEQLKEKVSEMQEAPPALPGTTKPRGQQRELKVGLQTSSIRVRSASR